MDDWRTGRMTEKSRKQSRINLRGEMGFILVLYCHSTVWPFTLAWLASTGIKCERASEWGSAFLLHPVNLTADLRKVDLSVAEKRFKTMALFISEMNFQQLIIPKAEIHCWAHVPSSSALFQRPGCLPAPWRHSGNYSDPEIFKVLLQESSSPFCSLLLPPGNLCWDGDWRAVNPWAGPEWILALQMTIQSRRW